MCLYIFIDLNMQSVQNGNPSVCFFRPWEEKQGWNASNLFSISPDRVIFNDMHTSISVSYDLGLNLIISMIGVVNLWEKDFLGCK